MSRDLSILLALLLRSLSFLHSLSWNLHLPVTTTNREWHIGTYTCVLLHRKSFHFVGNTREEKSSKSRYRKHCPVFITHCELSNRSNVVLSVLNIWQQSVASFDWQKSSSSSSSSSSSYQVSEALQRKTLVRAEVIAIDHVSKLLLTLDVPITCFVIVQYWRKQSSMHMHASSSLFGTMNGGLYAAASGDLSASVNSFSPIKSSTSSLVDVDISTSPPDLVHHPHHSIHHHLQQHHQQQPLHIPAKRPAPEVRSSSGSASLWPVSGTTPIIGYSPTEPTSNGLSSSITNGNHSTTNGNGNSSSSNNNNNNNNNNNSSSTFVGSLHDSPGSYSSSPPRSTTAATSTTSSLISPSAMATSAYHHGSSSHYPSLSSDIRRPPTAGLIDTKPNVSSSAAAAAAASLNFWQSDYHKYSNPSTCLTPTATDCQASFAAAHQGPIL